MSLTVALASSLVACSGKTKTVEQGDPSEPGSPDDPSAPDPLGNENTPAASEGDALDTSPVTELDLLFVIDNSVSMGSKQRILRDSVAPMIDRLAGIGLTDIHLGVITTSLGGHGAEGVCRRGEANSDSPSGLWDNDDRAYLVPRLRAQVAAKGISTSAFPEGAGFLTWNGGSEEEQAALTLDFTEHVMSAGEFGCGFEAPLEAWYRFLVDPQPPEEILLNDSGVANATGVDSTLLAQRADFLRPGGLVGIVIVSDEDDCSVMDGGSYYQNAGFGYLTARVGAEAFHLPSATSMCEDNPNDTCCFSCLQQASPPSGCGDFAAECSQSESLPAEDDRANVRCFDQQRRFGVDLLYPIERYVDALTKYEIIDARTSTAVNNPLLRGAGAHTGISRHSSRVFIAGIVGVPWQDVATPASLDDDARNELLDSVQLGEDNVSVAGTVVSRFDLMLGEPGKSENSIACERDAAGCGARPSLPYDPFMIPSIAERIGLHASGQEFPTENPLSGDRIVDSSSTDPRANNINGHETDNSVPDPYFEGASNNDLQYVCTYPLEEPREQCDLTTRGCDCGDEPSKNRSLCQPPTGGPATTTQYFAKAYPAPRLISVLSEVPEQSVVSSICPKVLTGDPSAPSYGYNPTFEALFEKFELAVEASQQ